MSWIALADEVGAIRFAIESDALSGPANLVAPNPVTNGEFAATLGRVLHRPTLLPTPLLPLKARFGAELVETLLMVSQRVAPGRLQAAGYPFRFESLETALRAVVSA
jgi:NAD dependent epimerase/dehydratase family enzyme